jgi:hypothetical protein
MQMCPLEFEIQILLFEFESGFRCVSVPRSESEDLGDF